MERPYSLFRAFQILHWLLGIEFMWPISPFNQVLELLSTTWCLGVNDTFDFIDVWIVHVCAYYKAWILVALARNWILSCRM